MADRVRGEFGRGYEPALLLEVTDKLRQVYNAPGVSPWAPETWRSMVEVVAHALTLPESEADRACAIIVTTNLQVEEMAATVILTCAFLESLLSRVFVRVAERHGMATEEAEETVDALRGFTTKNRDRRSFLVFFQRQTGQSLEQAFEQLGHREFWDDWAQAREDRNDILHGTLPFAPADSRKRVALLLEQAIPLFADLQNRYGVATPQP